MRDHATSFGPAATVYERAGVPALAGTAEGLPLPDHYVILLDAGDRAAVLDRVRHLTATHPDLAGRDTFPLPYVTQCARADLPQR